MRDTFASRLGDQPYRTKLANWRAIRSALSREHSYHDRDQPGASRFPHDHARQRSEGFAMDRVARWRGRLDVQRPRIAVPWL